jgi:RNA polymerase sigma-70 factor (ECF subfamily)
MTEAELARLYREYGYVLFRRCLVYLGDEAGAQDAVQEVFVRALRSAEAFRGEANPRTWLCRIADHLCVDLLRRKRRSPVRALGAADVESAEPAGAQQVAAAIVDDDYESFLAVQRLLAVLDPDARRLAVLYYLDEYTQEEIASELGLSRRTIGKRLKALERRARELLGRESSA